MVVQIQIDSAMAWAPEFFRWLTAALRRDGHQVCLVSSRTHSEENVAAAAKELSRQGLTYDRLVLSPDPELIDEGRLPAGLEPAYRKYAGKLIVAEDLGTELLFDDCGVTGELFRKHLPKVRVLRPLLPLSKR
jgi:hypothetical protein